ncbi:hypothetical protein ANCDUO_05555 [Ancylostoma duodenale]|uniref:Uncharacterized protein n=1 Tax=Ancylostoma duodenale TaxID=51022 RepID=A0A0C2D3T7_9BILA|nr:hypothetical protein ANCDUO_05555 [Ancylostoma duodenale]
MAGGRTPSANAAIEASQAAKPENNGPGSDSGRVRGGLGRRCLPHVTRTQDLVVEKLDEPTHKTYKATYETYSKNVLPLKLHEIDLDTTIDNLHKLFRPGKKVVRRRYEFLRPNDLTNLSHLETRLRVLYQLNRLKKSDPALLPDDSIYMCEMFATLRTDSRAVENKEVNAANQRKPAKQLASVPAELGFPIPSSTKGSFVAFTVVHRRKCISS